MVAVVLSPSVTEDLTVTKTCKPNNSSYFTAIPVIDLQDPNAKTLIVNACQEFGFFKVVNHGVPVKLISELESLAIQFFNFSQLQKDRAGPPNPSGYGNKKIGPNGDVGWIEYLLLKATHDSVSQISSSIFPENPDVFRCALTEYIKEVKEMVCRVLEMAVEGLGISDKEEISKLLRDENSDCMFRLNHYLPYTPELLQTAAMRNINLNLIGFGEHTDPQIMSAVRSNNTPGLQFSLKDGTWVSVPPDPTSFFLNVGDTLQVMTNGRFKSVRHRVYVVDNVRSRMSMIFFGGPPMGHKIAALPSMIREEQGEESLYKDFTWSEYKHSAYKTRLADNRLSFFLKNAP
ncbi:gibberellin 2-beta-dioxygenase-like [Impatiens glandulifera]|uniref:gibberellin 2-beta-dioxygenase-like n=1 Tax=Impatiens glandulifera TaxID=253017 RepID=UPI001FB16A2B|nr:gibberellin 2-beta-dioxygenase-like [Impatiens glandulifera]